MALRHPPSTMRAVEPIEGSMYVRGFTHQMRQFGVQRMKICVATMLSIAFILGKSVKLRASVTRQVPSGGDGQQGQKGEIGQIGPMGEQGAPGKHGPKGDDGMGLPGKKGPRGPPGLDGATGETGVKGQKGEPDTRLPFQETETLMPGTIFDLDTGTFTCNAPGTYAFTFSVLKFISSDNLYVHLVKNNYRVITTHEASSQHGQVSASVVLALQNGDTVYLTIYGRVHGTSTEHFSSFSGVLLWPE
ncbi:complement C1q tumor necrosis factor-related protein 2-like [Patiria miniata]|uniref:C1q domain-containing protein n=1 Tax=Patiria miniata TaxID=46514 RepID=A0A914BNC6_PATMI|nr:complement C1q tumor necrosis factor-related protein 2-like [Patiria miniata]